jgi:hypothetical protein
MEVFGFAVAEVVEHDLVDAVPVGSLDDVDLVCID